MSEKRLSRRDAMKILGAAVGASALANMPSKWDTPELVAGVLPAHARQSAGGVVVTSLACGGNTGSIGPNPRTENIAAGTVYADILPVAAGVPVAYSYVVTGDATVSGLATSGIWNTDASGRAGCPAFVVNVGVILSDITFTLASGGHSCTQTLSFV